MPSYTFRCDDCGEFTLFFRSMGGNKGSAVCPTCSEDSKRVFLPPNLYSMPHELRSRIEKGMEPRRMTREELGQKRIPKQRSSMASRPWQA
ncbi:MAG TPA: zinc ribbon domain-containing protein [Bacillus bacterium]|uniref:zinc ribbon domain-containing protein n=1 Tax=Siminovitchia fordii TaxID=254759 RepID=UPI0003733AC6|nr:zinc ribbon domain-containing protein [Siminovitchia fordii]HBZ09751.1 zinc ribbon domain-containing protein [Bacillus sp. (in: firmicutes)]